MTDHIALSALRIAAVAVGGLLALWSLNLARRAKEHALTYALLSAGFALMALAALVEGILFEFAGWEPVAAATVNAVVTACGFTLIIVAVRRSGV